jgi:hypothetical protein
VLTWQHRIARSQVRERDLFGHAATRWRVIRTSNAYAFRDPMQPPRGVPASKSENPAGTRNQEIQILTTAPVDPDNPLEAALRRLGASIEERLLLNGSGGQCQMTASSSTGTPLILSVLAIVVSLVAVLMARANLQWQAQETWIRDFREQVATLMAAKAAPGFYDPADQSRGRRRAAEITDKQNSAYFAICLLVAEKGTKYEAFAEPLNRLLSSTGEAEDSREFVTAAADILRRERATLDADPWWLALLRLGAVGRRPWSRLRAWLRRDLPRFPDLP